MAHQLWVSPETGYRRVGTRFAELRALVAAGITTRSIVEPLQSCEAGWSAHEAKNLLTSRDFDVAGVVDDSKRVIGFVRRERLTKRLVRDAMEKLDVEDLISDGTPLPNLLLAFRNRSHFFVIAAAKVEGIVTRSDFNKPPVRIYVFGLLSLLEMHLTFWISQAYPGDSWQDALGNDELTRARGVLRVRKRRGQASSLFEALGFSARRKLLLAKADLLKTLQLRDQQDADTTLKFAEDLRNNLAHAHYDVVDPTQWERLPHLIQWIERFLHRSDELVEARANANGGARLSALTRPAGV